MFTTVLCEKMKILVAVCYSPKQYQMDSARRTKLPCSLLVQQQGEQAVAVCHVFLLWYMHIISQTLLMLGRCVLIMFWKDFPHCVLDGAQNI